MGEMVSVKLPSDVVALLRERLGAREFASNDEAVLAAIEDMLESVPADDYRLDALRERLRHSMDDPRANISGNAARQHLDLLYAKNRA